MSSSLFFSSGTPSDVTINIPWKEEVLDVGAVSLPGSPSAGDRYVLAAGHGTNPNEIAEYSGAAWVYTVPEESWVLYSEADDGLFAFDGSAWLFIGPSPDHNLLIGLQGGTTDEYYHFTSAQHGELVNAATLLAAATNGQLIVGSTGVDPVAATLTGSTTVSVANAAGSITLDLNTDGINDTHIDWGSGANQVNAGDVPMSQTGSPTFTTVQHLQDIFHSSGWVSGGAITDGGANTANVSLGTGLIRATDSPTVALSFFDWPAATGLSVPVDTTRWVGIEYNAGTPQAVVRSSDNYDRNTDFILGVVVNEGGTLHIQNVPHAVGDHANAMLQRNHEAMGTQRDNVTGGLILGEAGTRNITVSTGKLWDRLSEFSIAAVDTTGGGGDTFDRYLTDGLGGHTKEASQTQWNNTQYDNAGTLTTLGSNKYAVQWFYIELDGQLTSMYGTASYNSLAQAERETAPADVPDRILYHGKLIGRLLFKKSDATAQSIETIFQTVFQGSLVSNHNNLANLDFASAGHTGFQAEDATLTSIATLGTAGDKLAYTTAIDTWAETTLTAAGRAILDDANAAAQATTLGLGTTDAPVWNGATFNGNVILADGVTLGQAAGPLLTFNDTNNFLGISGGTVGVGIIVPDGTLHVHSATAGAVAAHTAWDDLVVENSSTGGITVLTPDASTGGLIFGSASDNVGAKLTWNYTNGLLALWPALPGAELQLGYGEEAEGIRIGSSGNIGIKVTNPLSLLHLNTSTEELEVVDAGSTSATEQDWIEVEVGGNIGYVRVFATK